MNIARIKYDQQIYYAAIDTEKDCATLIDGDIFGREIVLTNTSLPLDDCTLLAPVKPPHVYAIGLNYAAHVDEFKHIDPTRANPDDPIAFLCATTAITGPNSPIEISRLDHTVDYEGELVAVIGRRCSRVSEEEALDYVLGYDVSDRTYQNADKQWLRAKSQPTYKPLGPWIVTDIKDPQNLAVRSYLNGELRQNGNSQLMIFSIARLIAHLSAFTTLEPGDLIYSGTPAGVGHLAPGDTITVEIEGIGTLTNTAVAGE
jgi:2-keto-4-pentenoate hydratase/2-oxohepta-3-ene-1,7-dioic acid hydratase in catechol pathway